ncbi:alpha/beta fold hydrolase [Streptomyces sp. NPDC059409]|uniref:alpha/beta fold hydrolase n=1 Tax=Streptomyces sp. NPDC059409 TaxID=3346824 RepID=UPI0036AAA1E3
MVLLHGAPKTGYHWRHLVPKLTPHHTVVVPDLRGLGDSARPVSGYDSATMSDDTAELMARLGHETYAVIGEDWGAVIGYQLAARHPRRRRGVRALLLHARRYPRDARRLPGDAHRRRTEPAGRPEEAGHPGPGTRRLRLHRCTQRGPGAARGPRRHRTRLQRGPRPRGGSTRRDGRRGPAVPGGPPLTDVRPPSHKVPAPCSVHAGEGQMTKPTPCSCPKPCPPPSVAPRKVVPAPPGFGAWDTCFRSARGGGLVPAPRTRPQPDTDTERGPRWPVTRG